MLFESSINLKMKDAEVIYYPKLFNEDIADSHFSNLLHQIHWKQDKIKVFGKAHLQPRLTAFFANNKNTYKYSSIIMQPKPFSGDLLKIKKTIETILCINFTSCLANLYRDGKDSNGWHSDDEIELGKNPIIASVSFGAERIFHFKHKFDKTLKSKLILEHGSLLLMKGKTQTYWQHQIPKTQKVIGKRINLTFRIIA